LRSRISVLLLADIPVFIRTFANDCERQRRDNIIAWADRREAQVAGDFMREG